MHIQYCVKSVSSHVVHVFRTEQKRRLWLSHHSPWWDLRLFEQAVSDHCNDFDCGRCPLCEACAKSDVSTAAFFEFITRSELKPVPEKKPFVPVPRHMALECVYDERGLMILRGITT